ncbi:hypothetical protein ACWPKO_29965 (plasmid) [Coraliomargarita sp. W4R53]
MTTPRATLVWAPTGREAVELRSALAAAGYGIFGVDESELEFVMPASDEQDSPDLARIINVEIGAAAHDALTALVAAGHELVWHPLQRRPGRKAWGIPVSARREPKPNIVGCIDGAYTPPQRRGWGPVERAVHFGIKVRGSQKYGLRITRDQYAKVNKQSSTSRWSRELDPALWDRLDDIYEDAEHRIHTDEWCAGQRKRGLRNFDLNMAHFASLDRDEFNTSLQRAVAKQRGMVEVKDFTKWAGKPGLYVMVFDEYAQVYLGATIHAGGIMARIQQHWRGTKPFDRLLWPDENTSILSIDSFRALDTTRIFALRSSNPFERENQVLDSIPSKFALNRIMGGDAARFAGLLGVNAIIKQREFAAPGRASSPHEGS